MSQASKTTRATVTVLVPTLGGAVRLAESLPAILRAVATRGVKGDEILVIDDSGKDTAAGAVSEILSSLKDSARTSSVRVVSTEGNLGFGPAVMHGAQEAGGELLFLVQDDVIVDEGVMAPLVEALTAGDGVFAAGPRVRAIRADGSDAPVHETSVRLALIDDRIVVCETPADEAGASADAGGGSGPHDVDFVPSSALLVRRTEFVEMGGFDKLFAPFDWEDVDLSISARRRGRRVIVVPEATAVHRRMPVGLDDSVDRDVARAVKERNRLLLRWKHLSTRAEANDHLVALWRTVLEAGLAGDRRVLEDVCLAISRLGAVAESRASVSGSAELELRA